MISHHKIHHQILISNRWKLRRRPSTSASRIISSTSSSVSFSSAEWYTHWLIHFIHHIVFRCFYYTTWQILAHITDISRNPMCYLDVFGIAWHHMISHCRVWHSRAWYCHGHGLEALWIDVDSCCKSNPNSCQTTTNAFKQFQILPYKLHKISRPKRTLEKNL